MKTIVISPDPLAKKRTDIALSEELVEYSRAQVLTLIKTGALSHPDGSKIKAARVLSGPATFLLKPSELKNDAMVAENIPLDILFHDEHLAIINKPAGLVVHPGAGVKSGTLCHALLHHFPNLAPSAENRPGIVHRLDKNTSGVMLIAKTHLAHRLMSDMFKSRQVQKVYRAYCFGEFQIPSLDLKTGHVRHPHNRLKYFTGIPAPRVASAHVRLAHTTFKVLQTRFGLSAVQATLHTGRTHQIRAHLADIGHAIAGDDLYGGRRNLAKAAPKELAQALDCLPGQALHAEFIAFKHPLTNELLQFSAPLPAHLMSIEEILRTL